MSFNKTEKNIKELWNLFLGGDEKAFTGIYYAFIDALWAYGKKLTHDNEMIKDSLQEIFLYAYHKKGKDHIAIENPKAYLFVALRNSILKKIIKNKKFVSKDSEEYNESNFNIEYGFQEKLIEQEISENTRNHLINAIQNLSPRQKEIIYLKFEEGLGYKEIAIIMKITVDSARKQLYRTLVILREILDKDEFIMILFMFKLLKRDNMGLRDRGITGSRDQVK